MELRIGDRRAIVIEPSESREPTPTVIVFHGHGSTPEGALKSIPVATHWPEARLVYPEGLLTPSRTDPEGKRSGWQKALGDQGDRDLDFVDAIIEQIASGPIFATGHSNGGSFCYLLWALRSEAFAGFAPSGTSGHRFKAHPIRERRPIFHMAGRKDFIVPFASQEKAILAIREFNNCGEMPEEWDPDCLVYPSAEAPVGTYFSNRGHDFPKPAIPYIVDFFRGLAQ
jgi:polyhydroxybutyrate depolymerase